MEQLVRALEELGVPDRWGVVGGIREKIARMLLDQARRLGPDRFRDLGQQLVEAVLREVRS